MKNIARLTIALLTVTCGSAFAGSFTLGNLPKSAVPPAITASPSPSLLGGPDFQFPPSASSKLKEGYIGTIHVNDSVTLNLNTNNNGPTQVAVPEPASVVLLGSGMLLAAWRRRRA